MRLPWQKTADRVPATPPTRMETARARARFLARIFPFIRTTRMREVAALGVVLLFIGFFWSTWVVYPLRLLVVFFHEISHGLAAIATGGEIVEIQITPDQGGLCTTTGGNRIVILMAGYLGSLFWGGALLVLSSWPRLEKNLAALLGILVVVVACMYIRPVQGYGFAFMFLTGVVITLCAIHLPPLMNGLLLKVVGLTSCCYALLDIRRDTLENPPLHSDAQQLAVLTGVPVWAWGLIWFAVAVPALYVFLRMATRRPGVRRHRINRGASPAPPPADRAPEVPQEKVQPE